MSDTCDSERNPNKELLNFNESTFNSFCIYLKNKKTVFCIYLKLNARFQIYLTVYLEILIYLRFLPTDISVFLL